MQRQLLYPAPNASIPSDAGVGVDHTPLDLGHALLARPFADVGPAPLIVFAHGNAELAHWSLPSFETFRELGFAVLLLEYPGYGGAPGKPGSTSMAASALQAVDRAISSGGIDADRIVPYGRSIGSGVASILARERKVAAVILESPFTSLHALVAEKGFPAFLLRDRFDNDTIVSSLEAPVFIYHGTRDTIIPLAHGERLSKLAANATLVTAECGHNDCPRPWSELLEFLRRHDVI